MRNSYIVLFTAIGVIFSAIAPNAQAQYVYNRADFPIATGPGADVAVADFNGDGILDLAVVMGDIDNSKGALSILLGKPDGTFGPHTDYTVSEYSTHVLVGDFNGDGKLDVAVLNASHGPTGASVSVLLGNGDGTFQPQVTTSLGAPCAVMVAGNFNGDRKLDLMAILTNGQIAMFPGNGDGTFGIPVPTQVTTDPSVNLLSLAVGDFNGDGKLDVAVSLRGTTTGSVAILLGKGDGTFQAPVTYPMQGYSDIVAVDVNHDGILDLIGDGPQVSVLLGNGDGTFQPEIDTGDVMSFLAVGDFNGDGNLDAAGVVSYAGFGAELLVILGDGKGNFDRLLTTPLPYDVAIPRLGDFNGDGVLDLALPGPSRVSILLGNGDGTMGPSKAVGGANGPQSAAVADFNGDGKPDLAIGEYVQGSQVDIRLGNGDGTFTLGSPVTLNSAPLVTVSADFNRDGKMDLATLLGYSTNYSIQILLGKGDGTFTTGSNLPANYDDSALVSADFNGDGNLDLLVGGGSSTARLLLGNGDGTFQSPVSSINWAAYPGTLIAADFNHDGKMDVAGTGNNSNTLEIFLGKGDGTFQPPVSYPTDSGPEGLVAADFNGDGKLDIAIATGQGINMLLGNGDGTFQPYTKVQYSETSSYFTDWIVAGDFNGDGKTDLAAVSRQFGILYVLLGNGDGTFSAPLDFSVPPSLMVLTTGDFNRDGVTDLALGSTGSAYMGIPSTFSVWSSAPFASIRPRSLIFGGVPVDSSSAPQTVNVWNVGTAPLLIASLTAGGDFSQTNDCGSRVAVGSQCSIQVTFAPSGGGDRSATLVLTDNATIHELTVPLYGTGTGLSVIASPSSVAFGSALVGAPTNPQTVTLSNTGSASLSLSAVAVTGPFGIVTSGTTCEASGAVGPGSSCTVAVNFTPTSGGQAAGALSFSDNAAGSPQTVALTGTGLDFSLAAASGSSTTATVTAGQAATYNLNLTATPGFNATINFTCTGAPSLATCTVSPSIVGSTGSSATPITVTVATTAGSSVAPRLRLVPPGGGYPAYPWSAIGLLLSAALALGLAARTHRAAPTGGAASTRMSFTISAIAAMLMALALGVSACGGGGGGGGPIHNPGTPTGTYTLTLTGAATSGSTTLTNNLKLTLTVN